MSKKTACTIKAWCLVAVSLGLVHQIKADGELPGLIGIQYGSDNFEEAQHLAKLNRLDHRWGEQDDFGREWAGRWWGSIVGPTTGQVKLIMQTNQDATVEIGGKTVLDTKSGLTTGQITMVKGQEYPIVLTYFKDGRGYDCALQVQWTWAGSSTAPIVTGSLTHSAAEAAKVNELFVAANDDGDDSDEDDSDEDGRPIHGDVRGVAFHKRAGKMDITIDGKAFATYVWSDPKTTRPYFKQVHSPGGEVQITRNHPPKSGDFTDHETYHPGIWWGFGDIGGNDYWRMKAKVIGGSFTEEPMGGDDRGSFTVRNRMLTNDGTETFCHQVCRYTILKRPGGILMICESTLIRDDSDFWLGDQEEMGLAIRLATPIATKSAKGGVIRDSEGRTEHEQIRTNQSDWCDYSGPVAGKQGGILLMNDPANFRKPWWHAVDTGLLIANPLGESELSGRGKKRQNVLVEKGKPFRLCYGVLVHLHDNGKEFDCTRAYEDFLRELPKTGSTKAPAPQTGLPDVPEGFEISVFAQEPRVYKPTAICFDARGRVMVGQGPQYPKNFESTPTDSVVLLIDTDGDGTANESRTFATGFNSIQGLAWNGNDLYVANAPELTVVRDHDGDDEADEYVVLYTDLGNREHALHGLNWGPDGKLYMSKGNSKGHNQPEKYGYVAPRPFRELWDVVHPSGTPDFYPPKAYTKHNYRKTYHHWDDDWGREGGVLRCDPMGANLEIVSRGLRNPWDMAMDDGFNWLATDNDQDQGDRIIMPFFGAHFGWGHGYSSHWTGENHLPTAPVSGPVFPGSGTGVIYYAHPHFPAEYRNVFFVNDWLHGTYVYRGVWDGALMQPEGGRWKPFATRGDGKMLYRPTDLEFAADGSIYICGWGGDYHYDRAAEGSWLFRVTCSGQSAPARSDAMPAKLGEPDAQWTFGQILAQLGPDALPVWRVNAQNELVRRGEKVRDALIQSVESRRLTQGQQTWAIWALGRISVEDPSIDTFLSQLAVPVKDNRLGRPVPLNLRIQALRILAYRVSERRDATLSDVVVASSLADPEPRIRFAAVQAIWQAKQTQHLQKLISQLAVEQDRLVFYVGWHALRELSDSDFRRRLLADKRPAVRLAGLLSLLERHEIGLEEVLEIAEGDSDQRVQNWALTWAMNPRPPKKMPNTTARVELEESVSMGELIERAQQAKTTQLRRLYLTMVSRATYRDDDDWPKIRDFYGQLNHDDERALILIPLARRDDSKPILWDALAGNEALRQAAVNGFVRLSRRAGSSPAETAGFLLHEIARNPGDRRARHAVRAMARLDVPAGWNPPEVWDAALAQVFRDTTDLSTRADILRILHSIGSQQLSAAEPVRNAVEKASRNPAPQLYGALLTLNPRLGIEVDMQPPEKATVDGVLANLPGADVRRGRELFFSKSASTACAACHRISGNGNNLAPDLSGIGIRSELKTIAQAVLDPSATVTEGYQRQVFETRDGLVIAGAVLQENGNEIRLVKSDGTLEIIRSGSIESREKTKQSAMPTGFDLLGNAQVADIVAFLATCRHGSGESPAAAE